MVSVWRGVFWVEIPLMVLTVAYWLILPYHYLRTVLGMDNPGRPERFLLTLYAGVTLTLAGYYAFILVEIPLNDLVFLVYQLVLLVGDVIIVGVSSLYMFTTKFNWMLLMQTFMAMAWGSYRVVFLSINWN